MVWWFTYIRIECNKNKSLVQYIDRLTIKTINMIPERFKLSAYILVMVFVWSIDNEYIVDFITFVDRLSRRLAVKWLIKNWDFVQRRLKIFLIVEVNQLLVTWKTVYRLMLSMWADFSSWAKTVGWWKDLKNKALKFVYKI